MESDARCERKEILINHHDGRQAETNCMLIARLTHGTALTLSSPGKDNNGKRILSWEAKSGRVRPLSSELIGKHARWGLFRTLKSRGHSRTRG